jgi:hypothetical protein
MKLEFVVNDTQWPMIALTVTRESWAGQRVVVQEKKQYDLAEVAAQGMLQNALRPLMQEIISRHKK